MSQMQTASLLLILFASAYPAQAADSVASRLRSLPASVYGESDRDELRRMVRDDLRRRIGEVNRRSSRAWYEISSKKQWKTFRDERIEAVRQSLRAPLATPEKLRVLVTGKIPGEGFEIRNLIYQSRPGLWVTANLYVPDNVDSAEAHSAPGILLCHSHHAPKTQGELQAMGMTWARAGCLVLVIDHLGHGERRQHGFLSDGDYPHEFRVSRQDYYYRYDTGIQLHLAGESLMGWLVWDLRRGVDVLLSQKQVDPRRIALLGAVAGGGDPAAVTAALDERIAAVVPFNFGGPEPESTTPLPDDAEKTFNYASSGSWESTRNLRRSASDGFLPWVIVGGVAPRRLIYSHEFRWDRQRDPVWQRLQQLYQWYGAADRLAFCFGKGTLRGRPPEASHCTNIGSYHRRQIHPTLRRWFGIEAEEYSNRRDDEELLAMTDEARRAVEPKRLIDMLPSLADERVRAARAEYAAVEGSRRPQLARKKWSALLGDVKPTKEVKLLQRNREELAGSEVTVERLALETQPGIRVPLLLLIPATPAAENPTVIVGLAYGGKAGFLEHRAEQVADLLAQGVAVCLPEVRNTGETRGGNERGPRGAATSRSSTELMLGGTMLGAQLRDVRAVLAYFRGRKDLDGENVAIWGDSFTEPNPHDARFDVPRRAAGEAPRQSEPLGGLLALLTGLYEPTVRAVYLRGGLSDFRSVLTSQRVYIPHDAVVPGVLTAGDIPDLAGMLASRHVAISEPVDQLNRRQRQKAIEQAYSPAKAAFAEAEQEGSLELSAEPINLAEWLRRRNPVQ